MSQLSPFITKLTQQFTLSLDQLTTIATSFHQAMQSGLSRKPSPLKMLPSYLQIAAGDETGFYLALDFGGTNIRLLLVELLGNGRFVLHDRMSQSLRHSDNQHNYTTCTTTATELFDFIASLIEKISLPKGPCYLGHTFSFPAVQPDVGNACLLHWTKEIHTAGVESQNVTLLLTEALARRGLFNVIPLVVINDTVGTLLAGSYQDSHCDIGSICGTGHNTAYLEPCSPLTGQPMIVNLESGNFNQLPLTTYDRTLDAASGLPGSQLLEKMASGHYLGELLRLVILDYCRESGTNLPTIFATPYALTGTDLSLFLQTDKAGLSETFQSYWQQHITADHLTLLQTAAHLITHRSAQLITATYIGILGQIDPGGEHSHTLAIDGSLYEKMPGYAQCMENTLGQILGTQASRLKLKLTKDGSGIGAAIATAVTYKRQKHC